MATNFSRILPKEAKKSCASSSYVSAVSGHEVSEFVAIVATIDVQDFALLRHAHAVHDVRVLHLRHRRHNMALPDQTRKTIADALRHGVSIEEVAAFLRLDKRTVIEAMKKSSREAADDTANDVEKESESGF